MTVNVAFAELSRDLVYAAMAVYTVAMFTFAVSFAATKGRDLAPATAGGGAAKAGEGSVADCSKICGCGACEGAMYGCAVTAPAW